jgi:hypothetical protein
MIAMKTYVERDSQGALRVGSLGVSLDSVGVAFQHGHSAETIQQLDPALTLEEVYGFHFIDLSLHSTPRGSA